MRDTVLRDQICLLAKSLFDRGLTHGSTGNILARTDDGGLLVSPTGTSFGRLCPARLSRFDANGRLIDGDAPTKEMPLHAAFYETRSSAGAVVHLHSTHSVSLSTLEGADSDDFLPALTPFARPSAQVLTLWNVIGPMMFRSNGFKRRCSKRDCRCLG
jgi:ribulose-5-phosphate 4-epimerase/fuculose-1-phosphate aldolase